MGRIRTLKPEFPQSESVGRVSRDARLLFLQLWTVVDDYGNGRAAPRLLAGQLYPYDADAADLIPAWLDELEQQGMVVRYQIDGSSYVSVVNWSKHQRVDNAGKPMVPPPPAEKDHCIHPVNPVTSRGDSPRTAETRREPPRTSADRGDSPQPPEAPKLLAAGLDPDPDPDPDHEVDPDPGASGSPREPAAEPEPIRPTGSIRDDSPIADLTTALLRTRYRAGIGNPIVRRGEVRDRATELVASGMTVADLDALVPLADAKTTDDPGALLAHWLDEGIWREVIDEQRGKAQHKTAKKRGKAAQSVEDVLAGIYGDTTKAAANIIGDVLGSAKPAKDES